MILTFFCYTCKINESESKLIVRQLLTHSKMNQFTIHIEINAKTIHQVTVTLDNAQIRVERSVAILSPDVKTHVTFKLSSIKACTMYIKLYIRDLIRLYLDILRPKTIDLSILINGPDFDINICDLFITERCVQLKTEISTMLDKGVGVSYNPIFVKLMLEKKKLLDKYLNFIVKKSGKILKDLLTLNLDSFECEQK